MNSKCSAWNDRLPAESAAERVRSAVRAAGAVAVGYAEALPVEADAVEAYCQWLARGRHGSMAYLEKYGEVRFDPRQLLPGARTVISAAFPYRPAGGYHHRHIADYALGQDYHVVLKKRLEPVVGLIAGRYGAQSRICVDTAPLPERHWAVKAGIGFVGLNRQLIVPGAGSGIFLAEILTTLALPPSVPIDADCGRCGLCVKACPGGALRAEGGFDARHCLSYLTIEHRGERTDGIRSACAYGCDVCQRVCPHNAAEPPEQLPEFRPDPRLLALDAGALSALASGDWRRLSAGTARTRLRYADFRRNLSLLTE